MVTDLFKAETGIDEMARTGVPETVRATTFLCGDDSGEAVVDQVVQCPIGNRAKWGLDREEQDSAIVARPCMAEVAGNGIANSGIKRIRFMPATLGSYDMDPFLLPVDIVKPETAYFSCAHAVDRQEQKNCAGSKLGRLQTFGLGNDAGNLFPCGAERKAFLTVHPRYQNCLGESGTYVALLLAVSQPGAQRHGNRPEGNPAPGCGEVIEVAVQM